MHPECGRLELRPTKSPMRGLNANFGGPNCNHLLLTTILRQRKIGSIVQRTESKDRSLLYSFLSIAGLCVPYYRVSFTFGCPLLSRFYSIRVELLELW